MIKYLGSKRALMPVLGKIIEASGAKTGLDLFTGTTRVAQQMKVSGAYATAVDTASYSEVFAKSLVEIDGNFGLQKELNDAIEELSAVKPAAGYFTETFCRKASFFQPHNGEKIDAIRESIESNFRESWLFNPLLASLILAADKVDSTTGVQMAFLKNWSRRSASELKLLPIQLIPGSGKSIRGDVNAVVDQLPVSDLAYLDPPYNQHRYFGNYHIWETLVRWDKPEFYGVANKRLDTREDINKSAYNSKLTMPGALKELVSKLKTKVLVLSYNNEAWLSRKDLTDMCDGFESVEILDFDFKRYVGSQIGGYNQQGKMVGKPGASRNLEHIVLAGPRTEISRILKSL